MRARYVTYIVVLAALDLLMVVKLLSARKEIELLNNAIGQTFVDLQECKLRSKG